MAGLYKWSRAGNAEALAHFYRAIELDPSYAAAHGLAARTYVQRYSGGWLVDRAKEVAETERLARRALELGRDDAVVLSTAGFALADFVGDLDDGDALIDRALALNPNLASAWLFSGWGKVSLGKPEAAIECVARAMRLSPQDSQIFSMQTALAIAHFVAGRCDAAWLWSEAAMRERPNLVLPTCVAATSAALAGRLDEARKTMALLQRLDPGR